MYLPAVLARGTVPTSAAVAWMTPDGATLLKELVLTNTTAGALTITLNVVPSGQSAATANQVWWKPMPPVTACTERPSCWTRCVVARLRACDPHA
jgi:hypothetical protein